MEPRQKFWQPFVGGVIWLVILVWLHPLPFQTEWATMLLLLPPLVLAPVGLRLAILSDRNISAFGLLLLSSQLQFPSALLLAIAFLPPPGLLAAALSLPWFITTALIALSGLVRIRQRGLKSWENLCIDAGLVYLVIGSGWTVLSRWGMRPLDFEPVIVLLTAIHFHYAGFLLPIFTGLAAQKLKGALSRFAVFGVIAGVPLVAAGITATQLGFGTWLESFAALVLAGAGFITAWLHLRLAVQKRWSFAVRALWSFAALSLAFSMVLAVLYGLRFYFPLAWLDIPWMRALHGTANALGFGLAGALAWNRSIEE